MSPRRRHALLHGGGQCRRGRRRAAGAEVLALRVDEFDADHQAPAAYVADAGVVGGEALQLAEHAGPEDGRAVGEAGSRGRTRGWLLPAAMASWLPRNVPACAPGSHASRPSRYTITASGSEPPMALESTITSGTTPLCSTAQNVPVRPTPVCTSSAISGMERRLR